jgi:hypothetical protein
MCYSSDHPLNVMCCVYYETLVSICPFRVIILLGAGLAGSVLLKNSRISDIFWDLSKVRVLPVAMKRQGL